MTFMRPHTKPDPLADHDIGPMLRDLRSLPPVNAPEGFEQSVLDRLAAEPTSVGNRKSFVLKDFLFKGSRLGVLSGSLALVLLIVLGVRLLQAPETRDIVPELRPSPDPASSTTPPATAPAASQNTVPQFRQGDLDGGTGPRERTKIGTSDDVRLNIRQAAPGAEKADDAATDRVAPAPAKNVITDEASKEREERSVNAPELSLPVREKAGRVQESKQTAAEPLQERNAVGGAVEFKNEYTPIQGKDTGLLKSADTTRAAGRRIDTPRIGK